MTDLSDKEKERLRQLEEEVEKERVREKKAREEAEAKARALMKLDEESEDPAGEQAKKKAVVKTSSRELQLARESRIQMRNKILVGGGGLLCMLLLWSNIIQLIGIGAFLGGGYFALNKYLVGEEVPDDDDARSDSGAKGTKPE
jgi:hypothetical protein